MVYLRTRLRKYRLATGLSRPEVTKILGLKSVASLCRWERGERTPSPERLLELSALYGRLVNDLLWPQYDRARKRVHIARRRAHINDHAA